MLSLLKTIARNKNVSITKNSNKGFWRYLLRCIFLKQFQYALVDIDDKGIENLEDIISRLKGKGNSPKNFLKRQDTYKSVTLLFSFLALLASFEEG